MRTVTLASLILALINFNCSKKDDPSGKTNAELILGDWIVTGLTFSPMYDYDGDGLKETNAFSKMEPCEKDNTVSFLAGGVWKNDEGETKCDPADLQTLTGVWELSANQTTLNIDGDIAEIKFLSNTTLTIEQEFTEMGVDYTQTLTLQRK